MTLFCLLQTDIQQREALVHFHAPDHSQTSLQQKALLQQGPLEPALHSRRQQLIARTAELKMKARELDAALQVCTLSACCCSTSCNASCCTTLSANEKAVFAIGTPGMQLHAALKEAIKDRSCLSSVLHFCRCVWHTEM